MMVAIDPSRHAYPEADRDLNFNPAGQIIGRADVGAPRRVDVCSAIVEEYIDAVEKLQQVNEGASA